MVAIATSLAIKGIIKAAKVIAGDFLEAAKKSSSDPTPAATYSTFCNAVRNPYAYEAFKPCTQNNEFNLSFPKISKPTKTAASEFAPSANISHAKLDNTTITPLPSVSCTT